MSEIGSRWVERRGGVRVAAGGSVVLHARGGVLGRAVDVSTGGIRVQLASGAVACAIGDAVTLELHLDGDGASWLRFAGDVTRVDDDGAISIVFRSVPVGFTDVLDAEVEAGRADSAAPQVLLVDGDRGRRAMLCAALRAAGCTVEEAATPLQAIAALGGRGTKQWLVMIADTLPSASADELRRHVLECHPRARVVPLGGALTT